jgi:4-hydroxybenzoate polyprenyltransferase
VDVSIFVAVASILHAKGVALDERILIALISAVLIHSSMDVYNDIADLPIDMHVKKSSPLVTGELSIRGAYVYMCILLLFGLMLAWYAGYTFFYLSVMGLTVGVAYSHPRVRLKDRPWISAIFVLGFAIEGLGVWSIYDAISSDGILFCLHIFILILSLVYLKDWKDIEGDRSSLPLAYGRKKAININISLMMIPIASFMYLITRYSWIALLSFLVYAFFAWHCVRILRSDPVALGDKLKNKMILAMIGPNLTFGAIFFVA